MLDHLSAKYLKRRNFLALCGLSILPELLGACQNGITTTAIGTLAPTSTRQLAVPTEADWATLASQLKGSLIRPGNTQYVSACQLFDPRYDNIKPAAIAYCTSPTDVQNCLAFVRKFALPVAPRSGGHSYAGYSTTSGLLIDVTRMNSVTTDLASDTATIGAGARLIDIYARLAQDNLVLPGGSCATVGITGLTLGGGVGVLGRKFGLTCDNLLAAQVVTADGRLLTCNTRQNADLFWALRGGGGGNFGIVTSFTFQAHRVPALTLFTLRWSWSNAARVIDGWQHWGPQTPDEAWSNCVMDTGSKSAPPMISVNGVYVGKQADFEPLLAQLTNNIGVAPTSRYVAEASILDTMLYEAGCSDEGVAACHLPSQNPQGQLTREIQNAKSDYFTALLPPQAINNLLHAMNQHQASPILRRAFIIIDANGGAINRVAADATAFAHRNTLFSFQYNSNWNSRDSAAVIAAHHAWLTKTWQSMRPYASGSAYQNYIDPDLPNWQQAYYGANLARLQQVKAIYDPHNLFHFAQSIPPA